jgi:ABC-type transporter Mla maintaining outer membrane lipid asymmetry ATPase subunit MlaF
MYVFFMFYASGTGKSVLLREIIKAMRARYPSISEAVAITASTGQFSLSLLYDLW